MQPSATARLEHNSRWQSLARLAVLRNDVYAAMRLLCLDVLSGSSQAESAAHKISDWASTKHLTAGPLTHPAQRDLGSGVVNVTTLAVAVHQVRDMVRMHPFTGI